MAPSGCSGYAPLVILPLLLVTSTFASPTSQNYAINHTTVLGGPVFMPSDTIVDNNCTFGTFPTPYDVVLDREQFALLVAITRLDLHRFANHSCDLDCAALWIQLGGGIYDREMNCSTITHEYNCSQYAFAIKEDDLSNQQLSHHYSDCGQGRSCRWADYQPEDSRPDYYAQMVTNWVAGMKQVEQYRAGGDHFCYNIPTEFASSLREEFNASILHSFRQTLEVGWYFEHFTLATFLEPFCGPRAVFHSNEYSFHYLVWSLSSAFPNATNKSIRSYMFSICPAYGTLFPVRLAADLHEVIPDSYLNTTMVVPDIMRRYVSLVMSTRIRAFEDGNNNHQLAIVSGDALELIKNDFLMMVRHSKEIDNRKHSSVHRSIDRKIVFYLLVPQMTEQFYKLAQKKEHEYGGKEKGINSPEIGTSQPYYVYIIVVCLILLVIGFWYYSSVSKKTVNLNDGSEANLLAP